MVSAQRSCEVSPVAVDRTALTALEEAAGGDAAVLAALQSTYRKDCIRCALFSSPRATSIRLTPISGTPVAAN
ncbi:hypothetical protein FJT64_016365 [Amphibalanus amphitrite]|uniref:Uncharacterized protein n=1 Tax=Amphibalanus amphitrite TaxID=1232801 RepID=A0A6A4XF22_AMPAM|nr:hypothetical protein FJT64_016365 [Amphibalanus amphitrite]